jgi:hypothetical protein
VYDLEPIFQFSRNNCVAICAFLVPVNLLTTIQTFILLVLQRPLFQLRLSAIIAIAFALTLFLHIATWFIVGVITPVTFILGGLGATCIVINLALVTYRKSLLQYFSYLKTLQSKPNLRKTEVQ